MRGKDTIWEFNVEGSLSIWEFNVEGSLSIWEFHIEDPFPLVYQKIHAVVNITDDDISIKNFSLLAVA